MIPYSKIEEKAHFVSHAIGFVIAALGLSFMMVSTAGRLSAWGTFGLWVYALSLLLVFAMSTVYHAVERRKLKFLFKKLDHISIYFLISGSYTVLILNRMMNTEGYIFLSALWGMTVLGIFFKAFYVQRLSVLSTLVYVLMGYSFFFDPKFFLGALNHLSGLMLIISGALYTVGAGFYLWKSQKWSHFVWHVLVVAGASLYFMAVYIELQFS